MSVKPSRSFIWQPRFRICDTENTKVWFGSSSSISAASNLSEIQELLRKKHLSAKSCQSASSFPFFQAEWASCWVTAEPQWLCILPLALLPCFPHIAISLHHSAPCSHFNSDVSTSHLLYWHCGDSHLFFWQNIGHQLGQWKLCRLSYSFPLCRHPEHPN